MTKYTSLSQRRAQPKPESPHPIWRWIGCLMILIVPVISYGLAAFTVTIAIEQNWPLPSQLTGHPVMPSLLWNLQGLTPLLAAIQNANNLYLLIALTIVYIVVLGAVISLGYAFVYQLAGPSRHGPLDAPPPKVKAKKYTR